MDDLCWKMKFKVTDPQNKKTNVTITGNLKELDTADKEKHDADYFFYLQIIKGDTLLFCKFVTKIMDECMGTFILKKKHSAI